MLKNVSSADCLITGDTVQQKENVQGIEKNTSAIKPYSKPAEFTDSLEISEQAKALFQKEKDVEFFTSKVLESPLSNKESEAIMKLIQEGEFIDNQDLAEALQGDGDLISYLFS